MRTLSRQDMVSDADQGQKQHGRSQRLLMPLLPRNFLVLFGARWFQ